MREKALLFTIGILSLSIFLSAAQEKVKEKDLSQKYQLWLKQVRYIIDEKEKDVFLQLQHNTERDAFMETFWKQRDPTPGTPQNEYRDEIFERWAYVNKFYGRSTSREGWQTDMGRIYMILGAPISVERFEASFGLYPIHVWSYYGDVKLGLPTHFSLVFWQRGGVGEFKLYNPVSDGPSALMYDNRDIDPFDYEQLYQRILERAPTLAPVVLSIVPGDIPFNFQPSPQNVIILADILDSPKKMINPSYATHFLEYKGYVSTEYLTNFVESDSEVSLIKDPLLGMNFIHFSMVPKNISVDFYEPDDRYYATYTLDVSLRKGEDIVFQYSKDFPCYFPSSDWNKIKSNGIAIEDSFPIVAGAYNLTVLLQNPIGKEFSLLEQDITVPADTGKPSIIGPLTGYQIQDFRRDIHLPYKVLDKKLVIDPKQTFGRDENVSFFFNVSNLSRSQWETGRVRVSINGQKPMNPGQKNLTFLLKNYPFQSIIPIYHTFPAQELTPDYYEIKVSLVDDKETVQAEEKGQFVLSPEKALPHPVAHAKGIPYANNYIFFYMTARQYAQTNDLAHAQSNYEKAFRLKPDWTTGVVEYAHFLLRIKQFDQALQLADRFKEDEKNAFNYWLIRGKAHMGMEDYQTAINDFLEGNKIYNSDIGLLNALGVCFHKTGDKENALSVLKASLKLNPKQENIEALIKEIEKKKKD